MFALLKIFIWILEGMWRFEYENLPRGNQWALSYAFLKMGSLSEYSHLCIFIAFITQAVIGQ